MYQSSLNDQEWDLIEHHFCPKDRRGNSYNADKLLPDSFSSLLPNTDSHS